MKRPEAIKALGARVCWCGSAKQVGFPFCGVCFHFLPADLQRRIYKHLYGGAKSDAGYEKTITEATEVVTAAFPQLSSVRISGKAAQHNFSDVCDRGANESLAPDCSV